jgi:L-arabinokinase
MYESHASYSACGLGSDGTDRLVALAREAGAAAASTVRKITGGGSGGTVAVLADAERGMRSTHRRSVRRESRPRRHVFEGSSPGRRASGVRLDRRRRHRARAPQLSHSGSRHELRLLPTASVMIDCSVQSARRRCR